MDKIGILRCGEIQTLNVKVPYKVNCDMKKEKKINKKTEENQPHK